MDNPGRKEKPTLTPPHGICADEGSPRINSFDARSCLPSHPADPNQRPIAFSGLTRMAWLWAGNLRSARTFWGGSRTGSVRVGLGRVGLGRGKVRPSRIVWIDEGAVCRESSRPIIGRRGRLLPSCSACLRAPPPHSHLPERSHTLPPCGSPHLHQEMVACRVLRAGHKPGALQ